jgi:hypothetical protein
MNKPDYKIIHILLKHNINFNNIINNIFIYFDKYINIYGRQIIPNLIERKTLIIKIVEILNKYNYTNNYMEKLLFDNDIKKYMLKIKERDKKRSIHQI